MVILVRVYKTSTILLGLPSAGFSAEMDANRPSHSQEFLIYFVAFNAVLYSIRGFASCQLPGAKINVHQCSLKPASASLEVQQDS